LNDSELLPSHIPEVGNEWPIFYTLANIVRGYDTSVVIYYYYFTELM